MIDMREDPTTESFSRQLRRLLGGRIIVVGIGNALRGDDGLGPLLTGRLARRLGIPCINAGISAERYVGKIAQGRPDTLLFIDAMDLGLEPGDFSLLEPGEVLDESLYSHGASVKSICHMLRGRVQARILVLGVQPLSLLLGSGVSSRIDRTLCFLEREISSAVAEAGRQVAWK